MADPTIKDLAYRGLASVLGGPVDLATMVMRPFGYNVPEQQVVGGSEWIGKKLEDVGLVSSARAPVQEFITSMAIPTPSGLAKGAALGGAALVGAVKGGGKVDDALKAAEKLIKNNPKMEEALKLAQQRAALPIEKGGLGLPANNTAMQRAAAMGFDIEMPLYHGTGADFKAFDPRMAGKNDRGLWGKGQYFTTSPVSASSYALREGDGANIIPVYAAVKNPMRVTTGSDLITRMPDGTNTRTLIGDNLDGAKIKEIAEAAGHDGVFQVKPNGNIGDIVTFNPENIRSRFAAFDPFRRNAAIAAAMGVTSPNLLAQEQPEISDDEQRARIMRDIGHDPYTIYEQTGIWVGNNE